MLQQFSVCGALTREEKKQLEEAMTRLQVALVYARNDNDREQIIDMLNALGKVYFDEFEVN